MLVQGFLHLGNQRLALLVLSFQRLFELLKALTLIGVEQGAEKIFEMTEVRVGERLVEELLSLLQALLFLGFLLLQRLQLAFQ